VCCGLAVWSVTVEPRDTPVGFAVRLIQQAPETRTTHRPGALRRQGGDEGGATPARGGAMVSGRCTGCQRSHIQTRGGGQSAAADLGAAHLAGHGGPAQASDGANGQRYGGSRGVPGPPEESMDGPVPQSVGSIGNERPRLGGWNGRVRSTPNGTVHRHRRSRGEQEERALSSSL
jgi:hypothetical protein